MIKKLSFLLAVVVLCSLLNSPPALARRGSGHDGEDAEFEAELTEREDKSGRSADISARVSEGMGSRLDQILSVEDRIHGEVFEPRDNGQ